MIDNFSPNMLKTYRQCPKKFKFKYIKNISMPTDDEIFETGKNIHTLASYFLRKENIDKMEKSLNQKEIELWNYLKNTDYFSYSTIATEHNLSFKLNEFIFGGRLDALMKNGENFYILDYKTGSAPKEAKYDFQTMIYMLAVSMFYKSNNVTFVYIDLKNKKEVCINLTENLISEYKEKLINITKEINDDENYSSSNNKCKCEYKIICY